MRGKADGWFERRKGSKVDEAGRGERDRSDGAAPHADSAQPVSEAREGAQQLRRFPAGLCCGTADPPHPQLALSLCRATNACTATSIPSSKGRDRAISKLRIQIPTPAISAHKTPIVINRLSIARCASTRKPGSRLLSITSCTIACASCSRSTTLFLAKMPSYLIGRYALNDHTLLLAVVLLS